ncbi:MAG: ROK family transcriptional regulator [Candidatus Omnitrophota bacterium]|jgi:predicted NBD/HSP70 family sugar kinase/predicted transcriptional regulator
MRNIDLQKQEFSEKERRNIRILEILRKKGPISRPDISKEIGINVVTVSNYIDDFLKNKLVYEKELDVSEGGRRPTLIELNPHGGYIIGVGLNLMNMVGLLVDLKGNILTKTQIARPRANVKEIAECVLEIIREILKRSKQYTANIKGIGVGIAGLINKKDGSIHWPQRMDHYYTYASVDLSLAELIENEFDLPVLIENDATCACFGEQWMDIEREFKNVIYMFSGVGCGIIINGEIYTGTNGYAGEVSIYNYRQDDLFNCKIGNNCFLKRWETDLGITEDLKTVFSRDHRAAEKFFKMTSVDSTSLELKTILSAAQENDPTSVAALERAAKRLGIKIAYLVNLLNPETVIIGGGLEDAGERFLEAVNSTVKDWAFREETQDLRIIYSALRENAVAAGAASLVAQKIFARLL